MPIDFHHSKNRTTYAMRKVDSTWENKIMEIADLKGKQILDCGCGGGIYSKSMANLGASSVTGLDYSNQILSSAMENCKEYENVSFINGNVLVTGLPDQSYDVILERAVIHHLEHISTNFVEAYRLLRKEGVCIIQDRTSEDCLLKGSTTHIRGYFFEKHPKLTPKEISRRHTSQAVVMALHNAGFKEVKVYSLWETRKTYKQWSELESDMSNRVGRSILHELSDKELKSLITYIKEKFINKEFEEINEMDRWSIWVAKK